MLAIKTIVHVIFLAFVLHYNDFNLDSYGLICGRGQQSSYLSGDILRHGVRILLAGACEEHAIITFSRPGTTFIRLEVK